MKYIDANLLLKEIEKKSHEEQGFSSEDSEYGYRSCARDLLAFINSLQQEQSEVDLEKVYDAYCKVCGHYHHTTPAHICRQACDYFKDFKALLNARKKE